MMLSSFCASGVIIVLVLPNLSYRDHVLHKEGYGLVVQSRTASVP